MHVKSILKVCFGARFGLEGSKDPLRNRSFWTEDMMLFKEGRQFTFKPLKSMTPGSQDYLRFYLNSSLSYAVSVHDEFFYLNNINPNGPPTNRRTFNGSTADYYMTLTMTEHVKLNLARDPCRQDFNYSFILCVRESLSSQVRNHPSLLLQVQNPIVNRKKILFEDCEDCDA